MGGLLGGAGAEETTAAAWVASLAERVAARLGGPDGVEALQAAVRRALDAIGAPTRPGGPAERLGDRWAAGEPLAEDTDWRAPLGGWRDTTVERGTIGELGAALLTSGIFAGDLVIEALLPLARSLEPEGGPARDAAERDELRRAAVQRALAGPLKGVRLRGLLEVRR